MLVYSSARLARIAVATGSPSSTFTQTMSGQVDIGWSSPPFGVEALQQGRIRIIVRESDVPAFRNQTVRLMIAKEGLGADALQEVRSVVGGVLVQDRDRLLGNIKDFRVVTRREPTPDEWAALIFGWKVGKHVKSNSIVYCRGEQTLGIGAGQMARVDSSRIAVWKAGEARLELKGSVVASEALFPFADGLIAAAEAGATSAIQPGGSVRDEEVIKAADERGMAMVFTGIRHFKH